MIKKRGAVSITVLVIAVLLISLVSVYLDSDYTGFAIKSCSDTDGGKNPDVAGTVVKTTKKKQGSYQDSCDNDEYVSEWFCSSSNSVGRESIRCPNGCINNACSSTPITKPNQEQPIPIIPAQGSCYDADSGKNINKVRFVQYQKPGKGKVPIETFMDECRDNGNSVLEWFCSRDSQPQSELMACPPNSACRSACMEKINQEEQRLTELRNKEPVILCSDTDGGDNIFTKGTVTGALSPNEGSKPYTLTDYCEPNSGEFTSGLTDKNRKRLGILAGDFFFLIEYYCEGGTYKRRGLLCDYGCKDGICRTKELLAQDRAKLMGARQETQAKAVQGQKKLRRR